MPCCLRPMAVSEVQRQVEIERETYTTQTPDTTSETEREKVQAQIAATGKRRKASKRATESGGKARQRHMG
ncbi:hypothetical protein JMJ77_0006595, partial [Colletotrichum scovillei]